MEENVFPHPAVAAELEQMVEARLHNDGAAAQTRAAVKALQLELAGSYATPIYVVQDPASGASLGRQAGAVFDEAKFAGWLKRARAAAGPGN